VNGPTVATDRAPSLGPRVRAAVALALVLLVGIGLVAVREIDALIAASDLVAHTHEVLTTLSAAQADVTAAEAARRGYALTGQDWHLERYDAARAAIGSRLDHVGHLTSDNPGQQQRLRGLREAVAGRLAALDASVALRRSHPDDTAGQAALTDQGNALMRQVESAIDDMAREENVLLAQRDRQARASARQATRVVLLGMAAAVAALAGSGMVVARQMAARARAEAAVRASEAMYRTVAEHFPNGALLLFDRDLRYRIAGGSGIREPETLVGRTPREALPGVLCDQIEPAYREALEGRAVSTEVSFLDRYHHMHVVPVRDEQGRVTAGMVMSQDVTERHRAAEEVGRLNAELSRSVDELTSVNQELEAFSYSVSHDLRAPLRHINGFVDLLQRRAGASLDDVGRRHLATIAGAARQMGQLIDDLLSFSRMGRADVMKTRVRLAPLVQEVRDGLAEETRGREIAWRVDGLPEVTGDPAMLRVVMTNLLSNAVKYSRTRPSAEIEVGWRPGEDGQAVIWVRDNGVGFDMQYAGKLFGVFQRLHRAAEFEGTGIGLATVRRIVHRHGGRAWAEGAVDAGATVYVSLPLHEEQAP
jgi:signal transduction histidine kinase